MEFGVFESYLLIVNAVGFLFFAINTWLLSHTAACSINSVITVVSCLGGSAGVFIGILLLDRKPRKENMMSRVFITCLFVIQVIIFLIVKGYIAQNITFAFWKFFREHRFLMYYLVIINLVTLIAFAIDKIAAEKGRSRIRIVTLLGLAFLGGSLGGLAGMYLFRHKIRKDYFAIGIPMIMVMQVFVVFYLMNLA